MFLPTSYSASSYKITCAYLTEYQLDHWKLLRCSVI